MTTAQIILLIIGICFAIVGVFFIYKRIGSDETTINLPKIGEIKTTSNGIVLVFVSLACFYFSLVSPPKSHLASDPGVENTQMVVDSATLKELYPKLEKLAAIYSLAAWRSKEQRMLRIKESNNLDDNGGTFELTCSAFTWDPYVESKPGQLFDCFVEQKRHLDPYSGDYFDVPKLTSNDDYRYVFKWESIFGYELDVTINPRGVFSNLKQTLEVDSACLTERGGPSSDCHFVVYEVNIEGLSVSKEVSFLVSDGYLSWNAGGSVDKIPEWVIYLSAKNYITMGKLKLYIQQILRKLGYSDTELTKAMPDLEAKWNKANKSMLDNLKAEASGDRELEALNDFMNEK